MVTEAGTAMRDKLRARADENATFPELLDYLEVQNCRLGRRRLSDEQHDELSIYCWALVCSRSRPFAYGECGAWVYEEIGG
jgi:hypothetical protein